MLSAISAPFGTKAAFLSTPGNPLLLQRFRKIKP